MYCSLTADLAGEGAAQDGRVGAGGVGDHQHVVRAVAHHARAGRGGRGDELLEVYPELADVGVGGADGVGVGARAGGGGLHQVRVVGGARGAAPHRQHAAHSEPCAADSKYFWAGKDIRYF